MLVTHPRDDESVENSLPIAGRATINAETMKGAKDDPSAAATRTFLRETSDTMVYLLLFSRGFIYYIRNI
jgi:hypothetical protein